MAKITPTMIEALLSAVGGSGNIRKCGNCMTRLRLALVDINLASLDTIKKTPGVLGVVESDEQLQIILGPGKAQQASELMNSMMVEQPEAAGKPANNEADLSAVAAEQKKQMKSKQTSGVQRFLSKFATILPL